MRDRTAATVRRAVLSPEAQAGRRAPRATAAPGAAQTARAGSLGQGGDGGRLTTVAVAAAATTAVAAAGISYSPVLAAVAAAGGGGGGSNLVPTGGTATIASGGPSVTISYTVQADTTPPTVTLKTPDGPDPVSRTATVTATFDEEVQNVTSSTFILERQIAAKGKD